MKNKIRALAQFISDNVADDTSPEDISATEHGDFEAFGDYYKVLTEEEAQAAATEAIEDTLWAFNASFLTYHLNIPEEAIQKSMYEDASPTFRKMLTEEQFEALVDEAIASDGRGHFLASYDHEENEVEVDSLTYYIYHN